jgi:cyclopropane fatty-acyl-phospholipid synthase-like methyltransferase
VSEEVGWLRTRLDADCRTVLEPGCGSGRIVEALARQGLEVVGIDRSAAMVDAARCRLESSGVEAQVVLADMTDFDLGDRRFDGAVCLINTLAHLSPDELSRHLERMAEHLPPGARYLVQLDLHDEATVAGAIRASQWGITRGDTTLRIAWATEELDLDAARQCQRSRIEVLSGDRAGEVVEELHTLTVWTPEAWAAALAASRFTATAIYDGDREGRPRVEVGTAGRLLWHELSRQSRQG